MTTQQSVAIIYGFAEGRWHGRKLRKCLRSAGFGLTRNVRKADIIIGHSAGCYLIPKDTQARLILHIGYTYWPGRKLFDSLNKNLQLERQKHGTAKWFLRCAINDLHMLNLVQTVRMLRGWHDPGLFLDRPSKSRNVFVRSQDDSYCEPTKLMERSGMQHTYVSIADGNHNDIWDNPNTYVNLLQSLV